MRIALVHDYLTQQGGAERVFELLCQYFPTADIFTSLYEPEKTISLAQRPVNTTFLQKLPKASHYLRGESQASTKIHWTTLTLDPLQFGEFRSITFESPFGSGKNIRQISDLAIDHQQIYIASTYDPGNTGVFRSAIYRIGNISANNNIILDPVPLKIGEINGLKVEGITIRKLHNEDQIFFGSDDENFGGVFRRVL